MKRKTIEKPSFGRILGKRLTAALVTAAVIAAAALIASVMIYNSYMYEQTENRVANMSGLVRDIMWDENEPRENMLGDITYRLVRQAEYDDGEEPCIAWKLLEDETGRPVSDCKQLLFFICSDSKERKETAYLCHPDVCDSVAAKVAEYDEHGVFSESGKSDGREYMIWGDEAYIDGGYFYPKIGLYSMDEDTYYSTVGTEDEWDSWEEEEVTDFYPADTTGMKFIKNDRTDDSANCYFLAYNSGSIFDKETCEAVDKLAEKYPSWSEDEKIHYSDGDWEYEGARIYTGYSSLEEEDGEYTEYVLLCAVRYSFFDSSYSAVAFAVIGGMLTAALLTAFISSRIVYADRKAKYDIFAARQEMTRAMAHDLKTPLTSLSGYAELLQSDASPEKREHYLEMIVKNVGQMDRIVGDILKLSKTESGGAPPDKEDISVGGLCRELIGNTGGAFESGGLTCTLTERTPLTVKADRKLLSQAIGNLLHNAAVYSKRGTEVLVTTAGRELVIENTPEVMPKKPPEELVKPFVKDSAWRGENAGSGVGLAIAKQNLERMGFELIIKASDGKFTARCVFR